MCRRQRQSLIHIFWFPEKKGRDCCKKNFYRQRKAPKIPCSVIQPNPCSPSTANRAIAQSTNKENLHWDLETSPQDTKIKQNYGTRTFSSLVGTSRRSMMSTPVPTLRCTQNIRVLPTNTPATPFLSNHSRHPRQQKGLAQVLPPMLLAMWCKQPSKSKGFTKYRGINTSP